jgi:hypothetical protein
MDISDSSSHPSPNVSDGQGDGSEMDIDELADPDDSLPKLRRSHRVKRPPESFPSKHMNMLINIYFWTDRITLLLT